MENQDEQVEPKKIRSVMLETEVYEPARVLAKRRGYSFSSFVRMLIVDALEVDEQKRKAAVKH